MKINIESTPVFESYIKEMAKRGMVWDIDNCSVALTEFIATIKDFLNKNLFQDKYSLLFIDKYYVEGSDEQHSENIMLACINKNNDLQLLFDTSTNDQSPVYNTHDPIYHSTCNSNKRRMRYTKDKYISPIQCIMFKCIRDYVQSNEINESDSIVITDFCEMVCVKDDNGNRSIIIYDII